MEMWIPKVWIESYKKVWQCFDYWAMSLVWIYHRFSWILLHLWRWIPSLREADRLSYVTIAECRYRFFPWTRSPSRILQRKWFPAAWESVLLLHHSVMLSIDPSPCFLFVSSYAVLYLCNSSRVWNYLKNNNHFANWKILNPKSPLFVCFSMIFFEFYFSNQLHQASCHSKVFLFN